MACPDRIASMEPGHLKDNARNVRRPVRGSSSCNLRLRSQAASASLNPESEVTLGCCSRDLQIGWRNFGLRLQPELPDLIWVGDPQDDQTTVPKIVPMPAVNAMARAPQKTTRRVALTTLGSASARADAPREEPEKSARQSRRPPPAGSAASARPWRAAWQRQRRMSLQRLAPPGSRSCGNLRNAKFVARMGTERVLAISWIATRRARSASTPRSM